jgi:hypothetical protein
LRRRMAQGISTAFVRKLACELARVVPKGPANDANAGCPNDGCCWYGGVIRSRATGCGRDRGGRWSLPLGGAGFAWAEGWEGRAGGFSSRVV